MSSKRNFYVVLIGIDGSIPPNQILRNCMNTVQDQIVSELDLEIDNVHIDIQSKKADKKQKSALGYKTIHVQQYDIGMDSSLDPQTIESLVTKTLENLGFTVTGTKLNQIDDKQFYYR